MALSQQALDQRQRNRDGICVEPGCGATDLMRYPDGILAARCERHEAMLVIKHFDRIGQAVPEWAAAHRD